ncbi:MAG: Glutamyl-tRNA(Gln) amidotransferase subunit C [Phycisphaerae bacterium]|nr:Glutamyl-tRNA(Gln) amidotransferase subunit C [Phycisphaerae bacterium]
MSEQIAATQVEHIARLARLALTHEELTRYGEELGHILAYIEQLNEVNTEGVEPLAHPLAVHNVWRVDEPQPSLDAQQALQNSPATDGRYFLVPKVLEHYDAS